MTKKDNATTNPGASGKNDFFSGLSHELKQQMNHLSDTNHPSSAQPASALDGMSTSGGLPNDMSDDMDASLFAADSSSEEVDESGGVFDHRAPVHNTASQPDGSSSHPPTSHSSITDVRKGTAMEKEAVSPGTEEKKQPQAQNHNTASPASSASDHPTSTSLDASASDTSAPDAPASYPPENSAEAVVVQRSHASRTDVPIHPPFVSSAPGYTLHVQDTIYTLHDLLEDYDDHAVWKASCPREGQPPQLVRVVEMSPLYYRQTYQHFPVLPDPNCLFKPLVHETSDRIFLLFPIPTGYVLSERIRDPQHHWTIQQLQQFMHNLGQTIHAVHEQGYLFLQLSEDTVWIQPDRKPLIHGIEQVFTSRSPFHLLPRKLGYSAPEIYHQQTPVGPYTDVFALGVLLHYMISQCPLFNHLDLSEPYIPFLRVYQLDFPVGLDHVISRACHPDTALRYSSIPVFLSELDRAIAGIESRHRAPKQNLHLSVAHDIHIGISKGQRNPTNQDALFWRYDKNHYKGLFIIADGVSHCHYGSGDRASSILIASAREHWNLLIQKEIYQKPIPGPQRQRFIQSIFDTANAAISREVNQMYERVDGYVEDVMGSTCVLAFLDGNEVTLSNLGDSRSYLKTPYFIEQINVDHDYKTAQLQARNDLRTVQNLMGASLITRCVGTCRKDENLKVVAVKLQPDFYEIKLQKDDILLLCSDGLSDYAGVNEAESRETISKILEVHKEPISAVFWLVALANQRGGGDNISVLEIKVLDTLS